MRKRILILITAAALLLSAGCAGEPASTTGPAQAGAAQAAPTEPGPPPAAASARGASAGAALTPAGIRADYEYLWSCLRASYPFLGVAGRGGVDVDSLYLQYREKAVAAETLEEFAAVLRDLTREFRGMGHLQFIADQQTYRAYRELYDREGGHQGVLHNVLADPRTEAAYRQLGDALQPAREGGGLGVQRRDLETEVLSENRVAYAYIPGFHKTDVAKHGEALAAFYRRVADYPHLILDLTDNGGGSDSYWMDNIVAPNIDSPLTARMYLLYNSAAPESRTFLNATAGSLGQPLSGLPDMPALHPDDRAALDRFVAGEVTVNPRGEKLFRGKIWVLVGPRVYSSSETFAMFCKDTGFATLVGASTGGDGAGPDPMMLALPNSGLVLRYSVFYSVNPDGSNSEEFGTVPDVVSSAGETALETCLGVIDSGA